MSIASLSAKIQSLIPEDELIGSLTKERVGLMVRHAGQMSLESTASEARYWLAYALNTDIPVGGFDQLCSAFRTHEHLQDADLEHWYDLANTEFNRERILRDAEGILDLTVSILTNNLCAQLGVSS
jgi:hypothetical protein